MPDTAYAPEPPFENRSLFSDHFLGERLPSLPAWAVLDLLGGTRGAIDAGVGFVPVVSTIHDGATALTGRNAITGESVGLAGRGVAVAGVLTPFSGGQIRAGFNALSSLGRAGRGRGVREVVGSVDDARSLFNQLSEGATIRPHPGVEGGMLAELPGGGHVGFRPVSESGPPTVDISGVEGANVRKIKFLPGVE